MCPHTCQNVNMSLFILIHRAFSQQKCFTDEQFKTAKSKVVHQAIFLQGPLIILPWETSKLDVAMSFPDLCQSVCAWSLSFSERRMLHGNQRWHQISHWFIGKHLSFFFFFLRLTVVCVYRNQETLFLWGVYEMLPCELTLTLYYWWWCLIIHILSHNFSIRFSYDTVFHF